MKYFLCFRTAPQRRTLLSARVSQRSARASVDSGRCDTASLAIRGNTEHRQPTSITCPSPASGHVTQNYRATWWRQLSGRSRSYVKVMFIARRILPGERWW